jgi:hypothetical protein
MPFHQPREIAVGAAVAAAVIAALAIWLRMNAATVIGLGLGTAACILAAQARSIGLIVYGALGGAIGALTGGEASLILSPHEHASVDAIYGGGVYFFGGCLGGAVLGAGVWLVDRFISTDATSTRCARVVYVVCLGCILLSAILNRM